MPPSKEKRTTRIQYDKVPLLNTAESRSNLRPTISIQEDLETHSLSSSSRKIPRPSPSKPTDNISKFSLVTSTLSQQARSELEVRDRPPWTSFKKYYDCDLAGTVAVCVSISSHPVISTVRKYSHKDAEKVLYMLRSTHHENLIAAQECFSTPEAFYTVEEFHPLTLDHIVACKALPDQRQLAAIMYQVVEGLSYLVRSNLQHNFLNCSSILLNLQGNIRIARIERCVVRDSGKIRNTDMAPISHIMMELMQKYTKDDGTVGIDNLDRWKNCPVAVDFLSTTTSAGSFDELRKHCLFSEIRGSATELIGLAWFALISSRTFYSYTAHSD